MCSHGAPRNVWGLLMGRGKAGFSFPPSNLFTQCEDDTTSDVEEGVSHPRRPPGSQRRGKHPS